MRAEAGWPDLLAGVLSARNRCSLQKEMKAEVKILSRKYEQALRRHMKARLDAKTAGWIGRRALALRLGTLDLAKMHENALVPLLLLEASSAGHDRAVKRAQAFFIAAIDPIEKTHVVVRATRLQSEELNTRLQKRESELQAARRKFNTRVLQRKAAEQTFKKNADRSAELLKVSHLLQARLRYLAHRVISGHEQERARMSHELHDEIAQALLGINVGLAALKAKGGGGLEGTFARTFDDPANCPPNQSHLAAGDRRGSQAK